MKSDLIEKSFECLKNIKFNDATKETARDVILNEYYLTLKDNNDLQQRIDKAIELLEKENYHCPMSLTVEKAYIIEVEKINNVISILRGEDNE